MADTESGIEYEAEVYWTTSQYVADAKRLRIALTKNDIEQIRANYLTLGGSRHVTIRRGAISLSERLDPSISQPQREKIAAAESQRPKRASKKSAVTVKLPECVIRLRPRERVDSSSGSGDAA